jgi:hypothetical protein
MIRHVDVKCCPIGWMSLYLFARWQWSARQVEPEPFPDFSSSSLWFDLKVPLFRKSRVSVSYKVLNKLFHSYHKKDPAKSWCESSHIRLVKRMLEEAGVVSDAKTHVARGSGCRMIEMAGVSEDQIRRLGHWASGAMERHYLSALPRKGMRAMAGMRTTKSGSHYVERSLLEPPEALQIQVFPLVETWLSRLASGENCRESLSAVGFLTLLKQLRTVVLQDSVILMDIYPDLFLWSHPLFRCQEFLNYAEELRAAMATTQHPTSISLQQMMPEMVNEVSTLKRTLEAEINAVGAKIQRCENKLDR